MYITPRGRPSERRILAFLNRCHRATTKPAEKLFRKAVEDNVTVSSQAIQIAAGVLVVSAFAGLQLKLLDPFRVPYLALNLIGTAVLTAIAIGGEQFGFMLTNGVWAGVSLLGLLRLAQHRLPSQRP